MNVVYISISISISLYEHQYYYIGGSHINGFNLSGRQFGSIYYSLKAFLAAQTVKNAPAMRETWIRSLGWEDPLEKGMATQSSSLAWRIPWTEEPGGLQSMGSQRLGHD